MIADLRRKFVIVTTTLMFTVFGILFTVNYFFNAYWDSVDTSMMLEWVAESGIFTSDRYDLEQERLLMELSSTDNPIIGIVVDQSGTVLSKRIIGSNDKLEIPDNVIQKIMKSGSDSYKIGHYIYYLYPMSDQENLIVVMDTYMYTNRTKRVLSGMIFIISGVLVLGLITFYLSGFVTEPAKRALLREKQFISDASHELKTPLGAISINAQVLASQTPDNLYVKNIVSESERMTRLIERLLTLARLDEGELENREEISLSDLCEEIVLTYESVAYEKGIQYKYRITPGLCLYGNEDEIRQLIAILLDNALKNTKEQGGIQITCERTRDYIILEVINTGEGIAEKDLPHVFERFYTSDTARKNNSFGLGLAIAKTIVERHHGRISVESVQGQETVFRIEW